MKEWFFESFRMGKFCTIVAFGWLVLAAGCTAVSAQSSQANEKLTIMAAASLTDAFTELGQAFADEYGNVDLSFNFAGSSQLAAQLREGVVADVFASANEVQMETAVSANHIQIESVRPFASNQLALIVPADNPAGINKLADLAQPGVALILAVPGVPVRGYSDTVIQTLAADLQAAIYANLVSEGQNVRQVVAQIALGEADAGIVYSSDITPSVAESVRQIPLPEAQSVVASYPIAIVADSPQPELAKAFIDFVLSANGQAILAKWGLGSPLAG